MPVGRIPFDTESFVNDRTLEVLKYDNLSLGVSGVLYRQRFWVSVPGNLALCK